MSHAKIFSPSSAARNMRCTGAFAMEQGIPNRSNEFSDSGTADHEIGATCLERNRNAVEFMGQTIVVTERDDAGAVLGERRFKVDADRTEAVQVYVDYVRSLQADGILLVEQRLDFSLSIGIPDQFGTGDAVILHSERRHMDVIDLKGGTGVKVYARYPDGNVNEQLLTYGVGAMESYEALGEFDTATLHIVQPRLDHIDTVTVTRAELLAHAKAMKIAGRDMQAAQKLKNAAPHSVDDFSRVYLNPGEKQCQWCKAKANCPALRTYVEKTVAAEFADIPDDVPLPPVASHELGKVYAKLSLVEEWVKAVRAEVLRQVQGGMTVIGTDGQRMKLVAGRAGNRAWTDEQAAAAQLQGMMLPDEMYEPRKLVSVAKVAKKYDKKKTEATWNTLKALIKQPPGRPTLALGSDPRPEHICDASNDFDNLDDLAD